MAIGAVLLKNGSTGSQIALGKRFVRQFYSKMLDSTRFFTTREETAKFMESDEIRETEKKLRGFLKEFGAFKSPDPEKLAVEFDTRFLK